MNKVILAALTVLVGASFNTANAAGKKKKENKTEQKVEELKLATPSDSLSFAAGMVRTDGLLPFLKQQYGVEETQMSDFIKGYEDAIANGVDDKMKAYSAGQQIAIMVSQRMLPFLKDEFKGRTDSISDAVFYQGFSKSLKKDHSLMTDSVAKAYFDAAFKKAVDERNAANRKAGDDFLAANAKKEGVVTLPSGLQYRIITQGNGDVAAANDEVTVKYEGKLLDGTVFDNSYKRPGETAKFRPNQVIKGWTEALTMMPVGSKWELYIPQDLAYGERKAGKIPAYSALIFTVEVVNIDKKKETSATAKPKPAIPSASKHKIVQKKSAK